MTMVHVEAKENIVVLSPILLKLAHCLQNIDSLDSNESYTGAIKVIFTTIIINKVIFFLLVAYDALSSCLNPNKHWGY